MDNLLSYYGLVDARISASENDLPVPNQLGSEKCIYPHYWFIKNLTEITLVETTLASDHNSTHCSNSLHN